MKYNSEEYKSGTTLRERQVGKYKSENTNRGLQVGRNRSEKYKLQNIIRKNSNRNIQIIIYISEYQTGKCNSGNKVKSKQSGNTNRGTTNRKMHLGKYKSEKYITGNTTRNNTNRNIKL